MVMHFSKPISFSCSLLISLLILPVLLACSGQGAKPLDGEGIQGKNPRPIVNSFSTEHLGESLKVHVFGQNFLTGATVKISETPCNGVELQSAQSLSCNLTAAFPFQLEDISVTNPDGLYSLTSPPGSSTLTGHLISSTATSAVDAGGGSDPVRDVWVNLPNALKNDGAFALLAVPHQDDYSDFLVLKGYFSSSAQAIPATATVTGITMNCNWSGSAPTGTPPNLYSLKLTDGTNFGTEKSTGETLPLSPPSVSQNYGGQSDSWGLTLTPAIVNSANFGVQLQFSIGPSGAKTPQVDYCTLCVYFTQ